MIYEFRAGSPLKERFKAFRILLSNAYDAGKGMPSAVIGAERETFINAFLRQVFPDSFRLGGGAIVDNSGSMSGQLDVVFERPFGPSFPLPGGGQRLYLSDTVAAAIEIKSNITTQWGDFERTASQLSKVDHTPFHMGMAAGHSFSPGRVPLFLVGYEGPSKIRTIVKYMMKTQQSNRPIGVLCIRSGVFFYIDDEGTIISGTGDVGLFLFIMCLNRILTYVMNNIPDLSIYIKKQSFA